jgi:hypothetical protein
LAVHWRRLWTLRLNLVTAGGSELFRTTRWPTASRVRPRRPARLVERAGKVRETLEAVAQGERAAASWRDRENLAATEKRAAAEPGRHAVRQTLQRATRGRWRRA